MNIRMVTQAAAYAGTAARDVFFQESHMRIMLKGQGDFNEWLDAARDLLRHGIAPQHVDWGIGRDGEPFEDAAPLAGYIAPSRSISVPKAFFDLAEAMVCHGDPARFALAYRLLWRLQGEHHLLDISSDPDVSRAREMAKLTGVALYRMTAFARFPWILPTTHRVHESLQSRW